MPSGTEESVDTTVVRVQSKHGSELFLTPMLALAVRMFVESLASEVCLRLLSCVRPH